MDYTKNDEIKIYNGRIGIIENVIYEEGTNNVYCYEVKIGNKSGYIIYPDEIEE